MVNWYQGTKACTVLVGDAADGKAALDPAKNGTASTTSAATGQGGKRQQSVSGGNYAVYARRRRRDVADTEMHATEEFVVVDTATSTTTVVMHDDGVDAGGETKVEEDTTRSPPLINETNEGDEFESSTVEYNGEGSTTLGLDVAGIDYMTTVSDVDEDESTVRAVTDYVEDFGEGKTMDEMMDATTVAFTDLEDFVELEEDQTTVENTYTTEVVEEENVTDIPVETSFDDTLTTDQEPNKENTENKYTIEEIKVETTTLRTKTENVEITDDKTKVSTTRQSTTENTHEVILSDQADLHSSEELQRDYPGPFNFYRDDDLEIVKLDNEITTSQTYKYTKTKYPPYLDNEIKSDSEEVSSSLEDQQKYDLKKLEELRKQPDKREFFRKFDEVFRNMRQTGSKTRIINRPTENDEQEVEVDSYPYLSNSLNREGLPGKSTETADHVVNQSVSQPTTTTHPSDRSNQPEEEEEATAKKEGGDRRLLVNVTITSESAEPLYVVSVSVPTNVDASAININVPSLTTPSPNKNPTHGDSESTNTERIVAADTIHETIEKSLRRIQESLGSIERSLETPRSTSGLPADIEVMSHRVVEAPLPQHVENASLGLTITTTTTNPEPIEEVITIPVEDARTSLTLLPPPPQPPTSPPPPLWSGGECECSCPCLDAVWDDFSVVSNSSNDDDDAYVTSDSGSTNGTEEIEETTYMSTVDWANETTTPTSETEDSYMDGGMKCPKAQQPEPIILILEGEGRTCSRRRFEIAREWRFSVSVMLCFFFVEMKYFSFPNVMM